MTAMITLISIAITGILTIIGLLLNERHRKKSASRAFSDNLWRVRFDAYRELSSGVFALMESFSQHLHQDCFDDIAAQIQKVRAIVIRDLFLLDAEVIEILTEMNQYNPYGRPKSEIMTWMIDKVTQLQQCIRKGLNIDEISRATDEQLRNAVLEFKSPTNVDALIKTSTTLAPSVSTNPNLGANGSWLCNLLSAMASESQNTIPSSACNPVDSGSF